MRQEKSHHNQLPLDIPRSSQTIIILPLSQCLTMDIRRKVADSCLDPTIQRTAIRKMSTQTHTRGAYPAIASWKRQKVVDTKRGILVVSFKFLYKQTNEIVQQVRNTF